jgi:hypothetical protein
MWLAGQSFPLRLQRDPEQLADCLSERPISFLEMERMTHLSEQGQRSVSVEAEVAILVGRDQCD